MGEERGRRRRRPVVLEGAEVGEWIVTQKSDAPMSCHMPRPEWQVTPSRAPISFEPDECPPAAASELSLEQLRACVYPRRNACVTGPRISQIARVGLRFVLISSMQPLSRSLVAPFAVHLFTCTDDPGSPSLLLPISSNHHPFSIGRVLRAHVPPWPVLLGRPPLLEPAAILPLLSANAPALPIHPA